MKTILIIDDDELCRQPAAEMLRRLHWNVLQAGDGETGIEMALLHRPDVILCDLLMPRGNGFQVCRAVRDHLGLEHTKIIVCTGRDYPADRKTAEEAGADVYLVKPIEFSRLEEALSRVAPPEPAPPAQDVDHGCNGDSSTLIKFWGVRGSIPTPGPSTVFFGGNTSCVEIRSCGELIICDAGSGIRALGQSLMAEFGSQPISMTLLMTHTHWDHIQGFPFFVPAYEPKNQLRILGYEGARDGLRATLAGQMESPYFPVALDDMPGNIVIEELKDMEFNIGSVRVQSCFTNHPGVCVAYRLHTAAGSVIYMPDHETFCHDRPAPHGRALPSTLETHLIEFVREADVLIADAQYDAEEYESHVGWGHGCVDEVVRLALAADVKRLVLFHHDPSHDDRFISNMLMHARSLAQCGGGKLRVDAAREGEQITLHPPAAVVTA